jgi:hypothetical protein
MTRWRAACLSFGLAASVTTAVVSSATGPRFYSDDPLLREPDSQDASAVQPWKIDLRIDLTLHLFAPPGDKARNVRAGNVNSIDEVPDSNWFTNRIGTHPVTIDQAVNGPIVNAGPAPGRWSIIASKREGFAPGFTMRDADGVTWFVSFDAAGFPEAATAAIMVANKLFWALGYWQVENHLITVRHDQLDVAPTAEFTPPSGRVRQMRLSDLDEVFDRAERSPDGSFRAIAARALPGKVLGGFRYHGTRPDDPNDVIPHEHRRELRALKVFGAWTNLVDMKAGNTLDTLIPENGKQVVRHYLQDVGSTFGTGANGPRDWDEGAEFLLELDLARKRFFRFGFPMRSWMTVPYEKNYAIGRFEGLEFDPLEWKPRVPTAAFLQAREDDNFWAARRVIAFDDDLIRAIVKVGRYSHESDEALLAKVLMQRRDKIAQAYLNVVNPLVDFALSPEGRLSFRNAAVDAGAGQPPANGYAATWASFDNATDAAVAIGTATSPAALEIAAPVALSSTPGSFVKISVAAVGAQQATWNRPVDVYFRRAASGWQLVGVERQSTALLNRGPDVTTELRSSRSAVIQPAAAQARKN